MPSLSLIVARKEITDTWRDKRSLTSSALYILMGPLVVGLVSFAKGTGGSDSRALLGMASVFALVAAFSGGMNVAMDTLAGERERRSLLPLLANPISRFDVVLGKWIAISVFALAGVAINLLGFGVVFARLIPQMRDTASRALVEAILLGLIPLSLLAAAAELVVSTFCRSLKEAQTYLAFVVFVPMVLGMFLIFFPHVIGSWWYLFPIIGQEFLFLVGIRGGQIALIDSIILGAITTGLSLALLRFATHLLNQDEIVYGL